MGIKFMPLAPVQALEFLPPFMSGIMVISHVADTFEMQRYLKETKKINPGVHVMVDPPVFEGQDFSFDEYEELLIRLQPNEATVPDVRFDPVRTIALYRLCAPRIRRVTRPVAVPQGRTYAEWFVCLKKLVEEEHAEKISIVEEVEEFSQYGRFGVLCRLAREFPTLRKIPLHFLGLSENPGELYWCEKFFPGWVRTCDSAKPFVWAQNNQHLGLLPGLDVPPYPGRKSLMFPDFFNQPNFKFTKSDIWLFNICAIDNWCRPKEMEMSPALFSYK